MRFLPLVILGLAASVAPDLVNAQGVCSADPALYCEYAHPGSLLTGACTGASCFESAMGEWVRVVATDDQGDFPTIWLVRTSRVLTPSGTRPCIVTESGKKMRVEIPLGLTSCRVEISGLGYVSYYEHFVSNPVADCLAWVECRVESP